MQSPNVVVSLRLNNAPAAGLFLNNNRAGLSELAAHVKTDQL